jgi:hypothetical protein
MNQPLRRLPTRRRPSWQANSAAAYSLIRQLDMQQALFLVIATRRRQDRTTSYERL